MNTHSVYFIQKYGTLYFINYQLLSLLFVCNFSYQWLRISLLLNILLLGESPGHMLQQFPSLMPFPVLKPVAKFDLAVK